MITKEEIKRLNIEGMSSTVEVRRAILVQMSALALQLLAERDAYRGCRERTHIHPLFGSPLWA